MQTKLNFPGLSLPAPSLDACLLVVLLVGYSASLAMGFTDSFARISVVLLALGASVMYLKAPSYRTRRVLIWVAIAAIAIAPTILGIYLRLVTVPYGFTHDGLIQVEEAVKFLLQGHNPYAENYLNTPMAFWHYSEHNVPVNPALYHFVYLPFTFVFSLPFYVISQAVIGWYDGRLILLPMFIVVLLLLPQLTLQRDRALALVLVVGLNPLLVPFLVMGRNDVMVLFWLISSVVLLQAQHRVGSIVALAFACATKQTAWFILPFFFLYFSTIERNESRNMARLAGAVPRLLPWLGLLAVVTGAIILPFFLWDPTAFVDDVFRYPVGLTEHGYPIQSWGFGGLALALGWIPSNISPFPFERLQILFGLPVLVLLLYYQWTRNTLGRMWLGYGLFTLVIGVFSHVFNDNHVGYILILIAIGLLSDK